MRVGVVSVPVTYPAWPVNGFLISGTLLAPGMSARAAYPPVLAERYGVSLNFPDGYRLGASRRRVMREGPQMMVRRKEVVLELLAEHACDLLVVVLGETDKAQHDFWRYREPDCPEDGRRRYGRVIDDHYTTADGILGEILDAFGRDALVAVVSDHGAGSYARRVFRTNAWLRGLGLLRLQDSGGTSRQRLRDIARMGWRLLPASLKAPLRAVEYTPARCAMRSWYAGLGDIAWLATRAYRVPMEMPVEGIAVNLEGRQPEGAVPTSDYESVVDQVVSELDAIVDPETGKRVVAEIHRRDEVYCGPYVSHRAADVVVVLAPGYKAGWETESPIVASVSSAERSQYRGAHTMDGLVVLSGPGVRAGCCVEGMSVLDVTPTLLHAMGLPVPSDVDGRVRQDVFQPGYVRPVRYVEPKPLTTCGVPGLLPSEEREMASRLRGLGYVD